MINSENAIEMLKSCNVNVSANNQKKVQTLVTMLRDKDVIAMLKAQNVEASDLNIALYTAEKAIKFAYAITRKEFDVRESDVNMIVTVKSLLNAQDANETLTRADTDDAINNTNRTARAHVYHRKARIASTAQRDYCFAAIAMLKLNDKSLKARDCKMLQKAREVLKDVTV